MTAYVCPECRMQVDGPYVPWHECKDGKWKWMRAERIEVVAK